MKKTKGRVIVAIVMVLLLLLSGWALKEREEYRRRLAHENFNNWARLSQDIDGMALSYITVENRMKIKENANYHYFTNDYSRVMPSLSSGYPNLMIYYYRLSNALTEEQTTLSKEELEEGIRIFYEMNEDIKRLCESVLERSHTYKYGIETGENWKFRKGLIEWGSEEHEQVSKEIQELSDQYVTELRAFFKEWIVVEH